MSEVDSRHSRFSMYLLLDHLRLSRHNGYVSPDTPRGRHRDRIRQTGDLLRESRMPGMESGVAETVDCDASQSDPSGAQSSKVLHCSEVLRLILQG